MYDQSAGRGFGQSMGMPPRPGMDNRDPRFSSSSAKRAELGPRKLSNAGMQVVDNNSQNREQNGHGGSMRPKKQV
jgi:hypothetical protein